MERTSKLKPSIMSPLKFFAYCAALIASIGLGVSGVVDIFNLFNQGSLSCHVEKYFQFNFNTTLHHTFLVMEIRNSKK